MGKTTEIAWTDATFNPWWGCAKVSAGCKNCYAESFAKRVGQKVWGEGGERRVFGDKHWREPLAWNREAAAANDRWRVFCASMADVFEDHPVATQERPRLWDLIRATPALDWLLLTKRPENIPGMLPPGASLPNVWLGTTAENQEMAAKRIPFLLAAPAAIRFVSAEPLLGPLDLQPFLYVPVLCRACGSTSAHYDTNPRDLPVKGTCLMGAEMTGEPGAVRCSACGSLEVDEQRPIDWVIVGGESGPKARPFALEWARSIVKQCEDSGVACFVKQMGAAPVEAFEPTGNFRTHEGRRQFEMAGVPLAVPLREPKGGDMAEWPEDLRVREFPASAAPTP